MTLSVQPCSLPHPGEAGEVTEDGNTRGLHLPGPLASHSDRSPIDLGGT